MASVFCYLLAAALIARSGVFGQFVPVALPDIVVVPPAGNAVIRLKAYHKEGFNDVHHLVYQIASVPLISPGTGSSGSLGQMSHVFSTYGYEPKAGVVATAAALPLNVSDPQNRVYYSRPAPDAVTNSMWGSFNFMVMENNGHHPKSFPGTITLVPPSGALVGSSFLLGSEGWTVVGNKAPAAAQYEPFSRGPALNYYVTGTDDKVNVEVSVDGHSSSSNDISRWYFNAPVGGASSSSSSASFSGNLGIAYGGFLDFTLAAFSGDFAKLNSNLNLVVLQCSECTGPVGKGITLAFPYDAIKKTTSFNGETTAFTIPLREDAGWRKDPQNTLLPWKAPSRCDMIQVLSRLSGLQILGDWTTWYETVALDNVLIRNTKAQLPLCALSRPDASLCNCS